MSEFALGQRWVSHADVTLGLGIVVEIDGRRVTLHFPAVGEDRTYALDRAPLTRLTLKAGDTLRRANGHEYTVTDVEDLDGVLAYVVEGEQQPEVITELELDAHIQLSAPIDRLLNNQFDKLVDFRLRYATLIHQASASASTVRGLLGARTSLLSHQLYIASEVGRRFAPRVLLADEVGLGKTIEAGLILSQQLLTGRAHRVLVIVPDALIHQWLVEMMRRFNLYFALFDKSRLEEGHEESPFETEQLVLAPYSLFSSSFARAMAIEAEWDMVVIDEAHHLHRGSNEDEALYGFVETLSSVSKGMLLLTATPEQAGIESHFERLRLLDPDRFNTLEQFLEEQGHYTQWNALIEQLQAGVTPDELPDDIDISQSTDSQVRQLLDRYGTGRVLFRNTRSSVPGFPQRLLTGYRLSSPSIYADHRGELHPEQRCSESTWLSEDPRVHWLEEQLRKLRPAKVLVICAHAETALALEHHLHMRAGIRCAAFHEGLSLVERDRAAAFFADEIGGAQALICSEIGSEGRNFQFAHHLICFDLPQNPDLLEQRIGRLDRIGQNTDVNIHVPYLGDSAQEVLYYWHHLGLAAFTHPCAVGHAVYAEFLSALTLALEAPQEEHHDLFDATASMRTRLELEMQKGRDRLLEINSHDPLVGSDIIEAVRKEEQPEKIDNYAELLFDRIGVTQDYHSETCYVLRPSEMLITGQLPGLDDEGITVTFDRETALARDDIQFLTWEHPLIREAMDVVAGSELGNAALGTFKHSKIKPGSVILEALFGIDCLAPESLEIGRFLSMVPIRLVILPEGKEAAQAIGHEALNRMLEPVPPTTSANVIRQIKPLLQKQIAEAERVANERLSTLKNSALHALASELGSERDRLLYLRRVNPAIRQTEIDAVDRRLDDSQLAIAHARITQQALRVAIAT